MNCHPSLRLITNDDIPFLFRVFASTNQNIANAPQLTEDQRQTLLESQFRAQHESYLADFPNANFGIIQMGNTSVGRLYLNRTANEIHVIDIAILPEHRSDGLGSRLILAIQAEAKMTNKSVRIHVVKGNSAYDFYVNLGFQPIGEKPFHIEMQWSENEQTVVSI